VEITVSSRHTEISPALREAVEEKIGRLSRKLYGLDRADVHFTEEQNPRISEKEVCEILLDGHGHHIRCKVSGSDTLIALDRAVDKLEHQLEKAKTKMMRRRTAAAARRSAARRESANGTTTATTPARHAV
jgi:putative sigma-54 modulation protein